MGITVRQAEILNRLIREYIKSAQPVSSQLLEKKYNFGICPATIRIELQKLTAKGYLYQPHPSAGRIPTDRGYRFFVDSLLEIEFRDFESGEPSASFPSRLALQKKTIEDWFTEEIDNIIKFIQLLTKNLALISSAFVLSYLEKEKIFWKEGWEEILKEPEFREKKCIINFTKLLEHLEKNIENLELNSGIKIYIGKETPFKKTKDFSIIASQCYLPDKQKGIISLLGPKRMAYDKNICLINSLKKLLES